MKFIKGILWLLAVLFLITAAAFGDDAVNYNKSGNAKVDKGNLDGALADFTKAIELKPDYADAYISRGVVKDIKGDKDGAIADFNKAIELKPDYADAYNNRGNVKSDKGDLDGALADFTKAIELKPNYAEAYNNRGYVKKAKSDMDGALADFNKAIQLKPNNDFAYFNRGSLKFDKGNMDGALADFNKAIELNPNNVWAYYYSRGCLHYNSHEFTNALADFHKVCELNSDALNGYAHFCLWLVRARLGEQAAATKELQDYWDNRKTGTPDDWPSKISSLLTGQLTEPNFLKTAENADKKKDGEQHCEAYFYAGSKRLIEGDKATATDYFEKCLATGMKTFTEYKSAVAELKYLKADN